MAKNAADDVQFKIIADHIRSITFAIGDGPAIQRRRGPAVIRRFTASGGGRQEVRD